MKTRFLGSTVTLILGILSFLGAISQIANKESAVNPLAGIVMVLGALAYKSLKKRRLGMVTSGLLRKCFEILAMISIAALVLLQRDLKAQIETDPVPNIIIPLWIFVAYGIWFFKEPTEQTVK